MLLLGATSDSISRTVCPECGAEIDGRSNSSVVVCDCGAVVDDSPIDHGPEWRSFESDERERTGPTRTITRHDRGLSTEIGKGEADVPSRRRARLRRQRRLNGRAKWQSKKERNQAEGLGQIQRMGGKLSLGDITDEACALFIEAQSKDLLHGRSIDSVAPALLYTALRMNDSYRPLSELSEISQCSTDQIRTAYKGLRRALDLPLPVLKVTDVLPYVLSQLPGYTPESIRINSRALAESADSATINRSPRGIAGASILIVQDRVLDEKLWTQKEIVDVVDRSRSTLVQTREELLESLPVNRILEESA